MKAYTWFFWDPWGQPPHHCELLLMLRHRAMQHIWRKVLSALLHTWAHRCSPLAHVTVLLIQRAWPVLVFWPIVRIQTCDPPKIGFSLGSQDNLICYNFFLLHFNVPSLYPAFQFKVYVVVMEKLFTEILKLMLRY